MKKLLTLSLLLCLAVTAAQAHDVRLADGTLWPHEGHGTYFGAGPVRNVSVTQPQVADCARATWPDIPAGCITAHRLPEGTKGGRVVAILRPATTPN